MKTRFKSFNFYLLALLDLTLVLAAHWLAYLVRFEGGVPLEYTARLTQLLPAAALVKLGCFFYFGLYKGMWRYTSLPDLFNVLKAATAASLILVVFLTVSERFHGFSRSVFLLDWLFTCIFASGLRIGIRIFYGVSLVNLPKLFRQNAKSATAKQCVLLGAGKAGEKMVREIIAAPEMGLQIAAIFDDDPKKQGRSLHGLPIIGSIGALPHWIRSGEFQVQEALIAMPRLSGREMREVVKVCEETGLPYRRIPSLNEITRGRVSVKDLRDVDYKDLLGREPVDLDMDRIAGYLKGKTVLVTGAGGSIGSELCRQIMRFGPANLLLLDSSEFSLYTVQMELEHERNFKNYTPLLGNLQDRSWTDYILRTYKPDVIFHAAAYKHVPMLEGNPWQAVYNNVTATAHLVSSAVDMGVERLLIVSTDKAVRPANVMGASKRLTEKIMQALCDRGTRIMAVRFGNVIGSAGSVIPLFRRQIERGGPVTVTHPEVIRYFMTIEESCQLILQAGSMGQGGELFVLKMGQPVKIADMAKDLIRLSGKEPGRDVEIKFIGLRPGEKLYEELITQDEGVVPTEHSQIMVLKGQRCEWDKIVGVLEDLKQAADAQDADKIREILKRAVPEYAPDKAGGDPSGGNS